MLTSALSQWLQSNQRNHDNDGEEFKRQQRSSTSTCPFEDDQNFRQLYKSRRLADRMSYENLPQTVSDQFGDNDQQITSLNQDVSGPLPSKDLSHPASGGLVTEWNLLQQQRKAAAATVLQQQEQQKQQQQQQQQTNRSATSESNDSQSWTPLTRKLSELEVHPNALHDFHPKNRNWRHFEHYNEHDRWRREEKLMREQAKKLEGTNEEKRASLAALQQEQAAILPRPSTVLPLNDTIDASSNDSNDDNKKNRYRQNSSSDISGSAAISGSTSDDEEDGDAASISSSSDSEEEQFVWTKHRHGSANARTPHGQKINERGVPLSIVHQRDTDTIKEDLTSRSAISFPSRPVQMVRRFLSLDGTRDTASNESANSAASSTPILRHPSLEMYNRRIRAEYNARIMPEKVVLIRHGQSMGNINEVLYSTTPDNTMPLTQLGWEQAQNAGAILKNKILTPGESVHFIVSPYVRTVETFHGIASAWCDPSSPEIASITNHDEKVKAWYVKLMQQGLTWNEDSRLREQDFGNYQNPDVIKRAKEERWRFGAFYYRFPHGESASDVFDRVSTFLDSLWRSFEMNKSRNYVLVTHGIVLRVLLARYFRYTIDQFNTLANPRNCEMVVLGHSGEGKLDLEGRCDLDIERNSENDDPHVTGYKFHKRLRILPKHAIRKVKIRISPDD